MENTKQADYAKQASDASKPVQKDTAVTVAMETISVSVPAGLNAFAGALADILVAVEQAIAAGGNLETALPAIITKVVTDLGPLSSNFSNLLPALEQQPFGSALAIGNAIKVALGK